METESIPWLTVLFQGFVEPAELCKGIATGPIEGFLTGNLQHPYGVWGTWRVQMLGNRIWVTAYAHHPPPLNLPNFGPEIAHVLGRTYRIAHVVLQSQALYSSNKLKLSSYTFTSQMGHEKLTPNPVDFDKKWMDNARPITTDAISKAANAFVLPALSYPELERALRDYDLALEFNDSNRLIYLWRAVEEIGYAHDPLTKKYTPDFKKAARKLQLYYADPNQEIYAWFLELGKLAHTYARHAGANVGNAPEQLINIAQQRVIEIICRHTYYRRGEKHDWTLPEPDEITKWASTLPLKNNKANP